MRRRRSQQETDRVWSPVGFLPSADEVVIVDLDGTLAVPGAYNSLANIAHDVVNPTVKRVIDGLGVPVVVLSARCEDVRDATQRWLQAAGIEPLMVLLAPTATADPVAAKMELFDNWVRDRFNVLVALDDSAEMVTAWRSIGVPCFDVGSR